MPLLASPRCCGLVPWWAAQSTQVVSQLWQHIIALSQHLQNIEVGCSRGRGEGRDFRQAWGSWCLAGANAKTAAFPNTCRTAMPPIISRRRLHRSLRRPPASQERLQAPASSIPAGPPPTLVAAGGHEVPHRLIRGVDHCLQHVLRPARLLFRQQPAGPQASWSIRTQSRHQMRKSISQG